MPYSARLVGSPLTGPFDERARAGFHLLRLAVAGACSRTSPDRCSMCYVVVVAIIARPAKRCQAARDGLTIETVSPSRADTLQALQLRA
jgi:hypothetical protein